MTDAEIIGKITAAGLKVAINPVIDIPRTPEPATVTLIQVHVSDGRQMQDAMAPNLCEALTLALERFRANQRDNFRRETELNDRLNQMFNELLSPQPY